MSQSITTLERKELLGYEPFGFETISVDNATPAALTVPAGAIKAVVQIEDEAVRWKASGTVTTTEGIRVPSGTSLYFIGKNVLEDVRFISVSATSAEINVHYFK
jgi:hypothetical protein